MAARQFILSKKPSKAIPKLLACRGKVFSSSRRVEVCCPLLCRVSRSAPTSPLAYQLKRPWASSLSEKIPEEFYYTFWTI